MLDGLIDLPWWGYIVVTLLLTHSTMAAATIFLHRHQAHRAIDLHPIAAHLFRCWLWMTTGMTTREWVAVHRKHHATSETTEDPHSPQVFGINTVLWRGTALYKRAAMDSAIVEQYGKGTPDDWLERHLYTPYSYYGFGLMLAIDLALFGATGVAIWVIQLFWVPFWAAGVLNGVGHYWGYRNADCGNAATNIVPWGILLAGEELHNNHHTAPGSAKFSTKRWEFDIGWMYIRLMELLGLARTNHRQG